MTIPVPETGFVLRYSFLWRDEARMGKEEDRKDRPCAVVLALVSKLDGAKHVLLAPITHSTPKPEVKALEISPVVAARLNLDSRRS